MKHLYLSAIVLLLAAQTSWAQPYRNISSPGTYGPYSRPGLSPYLNLIRGGDPAANYYLGVIPERDRRAIGAQQGAQLLDLEQRSATSAAGERDPKLIPELPGTGHPTYFFNYGSYYNFGGTGRGTLAAPTQALGQRPRR